MNVIFISMDTLRADRLGCLGYRRNLTPNLDRIASEGALFTRTFASDIPTQPSHTALFTGRYGINSEIVSHFHPPAQLDTSIPWLPSIFQAEGYATGAVDHLFAMKDWFVRGYDDYMPPPGRSRSPASVVLDIAFPWLDKYKTDDFYLFLHFWDAHIPYLPPSPFKERYTSASVLHTDPLLEQKLWSRPTYPLFKQNHYRFLDAMPNLDYIADLYDAEVAYLDQQIGRLFQYLGDLDVLDNTMVVLFGDHGENMTEHDAWFDHAGLYDSVVNVPLILWAPGVIPSVEVSELVQLIDVQPTVLETLGMPPVEGTDGRSLIPLMNGETTPIRDHVFLSESTWQAKRGVRTSDWKYIRCIHPGVYPRGEDELYNLHDDPTEQRNVATENPEVVAEMSAHLDNWVNDQLQGRNDPMEEVVSAGLPAVNRLDGLIKSEEAVAPPTGELPVVASPVPTNDALPDTQGTYLMPAGTPAERLLAGSSHTGTTHYGRRRALFVGAVVVLAAVALAFTGMSLFGGGITGSGIVEPMSAVQLNFSQTAPVSSLLVSPGQSVRKGQILATQDPTDFSSKLQSDEAKLAADNTQLATGPSQQQTPQQLQSQVSEAQTALQSAQTKSSNLASADGLAVSNASSQVQAAQATLSADQQGATSACSPGPQGSTGSCDAAQHQLSVDQAAITQANNAYQQALQTQRSDSSNSQSAIAEAQAALSTAQTNEAAGTQPQTQSELTSEQAAVTADEAAIATDKSNMALTSIVAPFAGVVASVNGSAGELAGPDGVKQQTSPSGVAQPSSGIVLFPQAPTTANGQQPATVSFLTLQSRKEKIVAQIGESDIGNIHVGQKAHVTLPAQPGVTYTAHVLDIEPAAVNQSGKVYFLVDLGFDRLSSAKSQLVGQLSGLSADVSF